MRKTILLTLLTILCPLVLFGQGVAFHDTATYNANTAIRAIPNANIAVCSGLSVVIPCTTYIPIYSDSTLITPITQPGFQADLNGNFAFFAAPGTYIVNISGAGVNTYGYVITLGGSGGGGGSVGGGVINYILTANSNLTSAFSPIGLFLGNGGAPIVTCPYTVQADNGITTIDRGAVLEFASLVACSVTINDPSTSGMGNGFPLKLRNTGIGTVTVNRQTLATFNTNNGSTSVTSNFFTLTTGGFATVYAPDSTNWRVDLVTNVAQTNVALTNVANTFTAPQIIAADFHTKGPNPSYDITQFGGYIGPNFIFGASGFTTGSMSASSSTLTVASAMDFATGNGILVLGAGPAPTISTPSGLTAAPAYVVGTSTRTYAVVAEDYFGGRTAASATGTTTTAVATLGIQTATLASCNRALGVVTCTTTATHNFQSGAQVELQRGTTGDANFEGAFTITSVTSTTFTFNQYGALDTSGTVTHGSARVAGRVILKWNAPAAPNTVLRNYIYVCTTTCALPANAANFSLEGVSIGNDSYFVDSGYAMLISSIGNGDVSATPPASPSNQWLSTTIASGAGTTTLVLANSATNSVSGVRVMHDNAPNIRAACSAFANNGASIGGTIFVPTPLNSTYDFPIASTLNLNSCLGQTELDLAATTWLTGSIIPKPLSKLKGMSPGNVAQPTPFYGLSTNSVIYGLAYPFIYETTGLSHDLSVESITLVGNQAYQSLIYQDQDTAGNGVTAVRYEDVHLAGGVNTYSLVTKGGFGFYWIRGGWSNTPADFSGPPSALFTTNCGTGQTGAILPYIIYSDHTYVFGGGMVFDSCGAALVGNGGNANMEFRDLLVEGSYVPIVRVNTGGYYLFSQVDFYHASYADLSGGNATPLFDFTNAAVSGVRAIVPGCGTGSQPVFEVSASTTAYAGLEAYNAGYGCTYLGTNNGLIRNVGVDTDVYNNYLLDLANSSRLIFQMPGPTAPQSAVVSAGGAVAVGAHNYALTANDFDGGETLLGPPVVATTTTGNQTVTITMPASFPAGASGLNIYRDGRLINFNSCVKPQSVTPGGTAVDASSFDCGSTNPVSNTAGISTISTNGIASNKMRVAGEAMSSAPRGEQNVFLPSALTSTWTASSWTLDKAVTVTRVQVQTKTAPSGCATNAIVRLTDGTTPVNLTVSAAGNDSGSLAQNYAAAAVLTISVQTAAAGCSTSPADANVTIQYRMQ